MHRPQQKKTPRAQRGAALRLLFLIAALAAVLAACNTSPSPRLDPKREPTRTEAASPNPNLPRQGPGKSLPLHLGYIPEGTGATPSLRAQAQGDVVVQMQALVISAVGDVDLEPSLGAWRALLDQVGMPYQHIVATDPQWTPQALADYLVTPDGVGRFQAVLLSTNNLVYDAGPGVPPAERYPSAFTEDHWKVLFDYERAYGVRQAAMYGAAWSGATPSEDDYGILDPSGGGGLNNRVISPTTAGLAVFTDVDAASTITLRDTWGYPSAGHQDWSTPLLVDGSGNILATQIGTYGRERITLFFDNAAWGGIPVVYTQQLGAALLRWATRGVHIGERRNSFQADVDDWFLEAGHWDITTHSIDDREGHGVRLTATDVLSLRDQQLGLQAIAGGIASDFRWSMAFNGMGTTEPGEGSVPASCTESISATLTYITKCLADDFWWVSHTWDHEYMDYILPAVGGAKNLDEAAVTSRLTQNDDLAAAYGFGATYSRNSVVTGDISGLGWYDPLGPNHEPVQKVDHGLDWASPYFIRAAVATGHTYIASNMSTPSHEPDCWACGTYLTLANNHYAAQSGFEVFLVPRWPTNVFATVTRPAEVVDAYNMVYGANGTDPYHFDHDLTYPEILDIDTSIALSHLLSGSPYPHYFHTPNAVEYEAGKSLLTDWATVLFNKYAGLVNEPLLSHKNDDSAAYVQARTDFMAAGVTGTWNRTTGKITIRSTNGGPAFLTGASLGAGASDTVYNGRTISERELGAGQSVVVDVVTASPGAPSIQSFSAAPATINDGGTAQLSWTVFGPHSDITARVKDGAVVGSNLSASASLPVSPTATTTYELVVTPLQGATITREATVAVTPVQPVIAAFTSTPDPVPYAGTAELSWTVTGSATNIAIRVQGQEQGQETNLYSGPSLSGSVATPALTTTTTYELVATWAGGAPVTSTRTVNVSTPAAPTITSFTADPGTIAANGTSTLTWGLAGGPATDVSIRVHGQDDPVVGSLNGVYAWTTPALTASTTYELVATGPGGTATSSATVTVVGAPSASFTATPDEMVSGGSSTLAWAVTGATDSILIREKGGATLYQGLQPTSSQVVSPIATTTYELVMAWLGGEVVREATVTVRTAPAVSLTTANPAIQFGQSTTLDWSVSGVTTGVTLYRDGELVDTLSGSGGQYLVQPNATGTYELRAAWLGGTSTAAQQVVVTPTVAFSATPASIVEGTSSTLAWEIGGGYAGATLREQGAAGSPVAGATGNQVVSPAETTTYELVVAYGGAGAAAEVVRSATVTVTPAPIPPVIESFSATPSAILNGQSVQLQWNVSGTTTDISLTANGAAIGSGLASSGPRTESPTTTTTYVLSASWEGGAPITSTVTVDVTQPVTPAGTITATPASIIVGSSSTLSWSVTGDFTNVTVRAQGGETLSTGPAASGETVVAPPVTTTYELVATQISGADLTVGTATLTVNEPTAPTATLTADPTAITPGGSTTLSWDVVGDYSSIRLALVGGAEIGGNRERTGQLAVSPTVTTTYELRVAWANGTVTVPRQVVVTPTVTFQAAPASIVSGESATLSWSIGGGYSSATLRQQGGAGAPIAATGNQVVSPTTTTTYEIVVTYVGGADIVSPATVTVTPPPLAPLVTSFAAAPNPITVGQTTQLAWVVDGGPTTGIAIRILGQAEPVFQGLERAGTWTTPTLAASTTYELVATGPGGTTTGSVTVTVNPAPVAPVIASFTATPSAILSSQSAQLNWSVTGSYSTVGLRVGGTVVRDDLGASGALTVTPTTTTTYELFATWSGGPAVTSQTTVTVTTPTAPTGTLTAAPTAVTVGSPSTLSWSVAGDFTTVTVRAANGDVVRANAGASGTADVTPGSTTTYELVAQPLIGSPSVVATATVTVNPLPVAPSAELTADNASITAGGSTTLRWAVGGDFTTVRVRANGSDVGGDRAATGELVVDPATTTTYQLVVTWNGTPDVVREVTVTVNPPEAPLAQLAATDPTITFGGSTNLTWSVTGTHAGISLRTSTGTVIEADLGPSGSLAVSPSATTTYVLEVAWANGTVTGSTQVVVMPTVGFSATPTSIVSGESSLLSWSVGGGFTSATLREQGTSGGTVAATGSQAVSPTTTTTYEFVVAYAGGADIVTTRTVTVAPAPVAPEITNFTASPAAITAGGSSVLGWNVTGSATSISLRVGGTTVASNLAASGTLPVSPTVTTTYELYVTWSGGAAVTRTAQVTVTAPTAPTGTLTATPATITVGGTSTLSWNVTGDFTNVTVRTSGGQVISSGTAASGSIGVSPTATTTYQLLATPSGGSAAVIGTATVTVNPVPVAPTATFGANPATITAGGSSTLGWAVSGTYTTIRVRIAGGANIGGNRPATGQTVVSPTSTTTYELVVTWSGGEVVRSASVTVNPAAPAVSFSATPQAIVAGGTSTVAWNVVGAYDSVTFGVAGGSAGGVGASGSEQVSPTATTTYELVVTWSGGTILRQATVTVTQAPIQPTVTFTATPATITAGQSASLTWDVAGTATAVSIRVVGGGTLTTNLASNGSHGVSPETTTTYELVAVWAEGEVTAQATVTVEPATEPEPEPEGPTLTLRLSGEGFGLVVISPDGEACIDECELTYPEGTTVTISPVALLGSKFDGFTGACEGRSCTLTLDRDVVIDARFEFKD